MPRTVRSESDAELVARIATGDLRAVETLYNVYGASLLGFATRIGGADDAEDVVQDTFVRAVRVAASFDASAASARPWLFGIAANVVRERRRSFRRLAAMVTRAAEHAGARTNDVGDERGDVWKALERLSTDKRTVIVLAEVEGFSCAEIAMQLGVPIGTVWTRLHHARKELRASLGGER